ncbi:MAG: hypothetical protein R3A79_28460 [Nannocystaceae bacterium]
MRLVRRLALALVLLPFAVAGEAHAGDTAAAAEAAPATESTPDKMNPHGWDQNYLEQRKVAKKAAVRADGDARGSFAGRIGCMTDPSKCTCQSEDAKESSACGDVLGYFCPESTMKYLAASCMDLFGGAMVCNCASAQQIETHLKTESAGSKKAPAKKSSTKKKSSAKKK